MRNSYAFEKFPFPTEVLLSVGDGWLLNLEDRIPGKKSCFFTKQRMETTFEDDNSSYVAAADNKPL